MTELITEYDKKGLEEFISACEYPAQIVVTSCPDPASFYYENIQGVIEIVTDEELDECAWKWCSEAEEEAIQLYNDFKNHNVFKVDIDESTPGDSVIEKIGNAITNSCDAWLKKVVEEIDRSWRAKSYIIEDLERWDLYNFGPDSLEKNAALYAPTTPSVTLSCNDKEVELRLPPYDSFLSFKEAYKALFKGVRFKS